MISSSPMPPPPTQTRLPNIGEDSKKCMILSVSVIYLSVCVPALAAMETPATAAAKTSRACAQDDYDGHEEWEQPPGF